jgi:hypothetical protein
MPENSQTALCTLALARQHTDIFGDLAEVAVFVITAY